MFPFLATLIPSVLKSAYGLAGMVGYDPKRPEYKMPQSVTDAESIYQFLSGADMAGKKEAETNIFQSQANTLDILQQGVSDSSALLNTAPQIQGQTNQALSGLAVESAKQKQQAQGTYANFLQGTKAAYEDKMWQWNEAEPYLNEAKAKEEATQNLFGGIKDIGQGAMDIFSAKQIEQLTQAEKDKVRLMGEDLKLRAGNGTTPVTPQTATTNLTDYVTGGTQNTVSPQEEYKKFISSLTSSVLDATNKVTSNANDNVASMIETGTYAPQSNVADIAKENINLSLEDYLKPEDYRTQSDIQYNEWMKNNPIKEDITNTANDKLVITPQVDNELLNLAKAKTVGKFIPNGASWKDSFVKQYGGKAYLELINEYKTKNTKQ